MGGSVATVAAAAASSTTTSSLTIAVVSVATPDVVATYQAAINSKQCYCLLHGYTFELDTNVYAHNRTPHWNKVPAIERLLQWYDWVVYLDADAVITNSNVRLEEYIEAAGPSPPDIIFSDGTEVNTGAFFVRSTDWSRRFLRMWWSMYDHHMATQSYYQWVFEQAGMLEATLRVAAAATRGKHAYKPNHCLRPELDRYVRLNNCWRLELARMGYPYCHRSNSHIRFHCGDGGLRGFNQKNGISHPVYASFYRPTEIWRAGDFVAHVLTARASLPVLQLYAQDDLFDHQFGTCPWQQVPPPPAVHWVVSVPKTAAVCAVNPPCIGGLWSDDNNGTRTPRFVWKSPWLGYRDAPEAGTVRPAPTHMLQAMFMQFPMEGDGGDGQPQIRTFSYLPTDDVWSRHTDFCMSNSMNCFEGWANFQAALETVERVPLNQAAWSPAVVGAGADPDVLLRDAGFPDSADGPGPWDGSPSKTVPALKLSITSPRQNDVITGICCELQIRLQMQSPLVFDVADPAQAAQARHLFSSVGGDVPAPGGSSNSSIPSQNVDGVVCFNLSRSEPGGNGRDHHLLTNHCVEQDRREMLMLTLPEDLWRPSIMGLHVWWNGSSNDLQLLTEVHRVFALNPSVPSGVEYLWRPFPAPTSRQTQVSDHPLPPPPMLQPRPGFDVAAALSPADAFVTLIWGDGYIPAVLALAHSLTIVGSSRVLVVLVSTTGLHHQPTTSPSGLDVLRAQPNVKVVLVDEFSDLLPGSRMPRLGASIWLKLRVWQLVEYRCLVFLDADSLMLRNVDHLFLLCNPDGVRDGLMVTPPRGVGQDVGGMPLLAVAQTPSKWLNFSYAGVSTIAGEYRNAHTVGGFFVTKPSLDTFDHMMAELLVAGSGFVFAEASFLDKFFEHSKVLLPHTYMCIAEGLDHFYQRPDMACDIVDFQSCGALHWKPWDNVPPPNTPSTICRFMPTRGYLSAIAAWQQVYSIVAPTNTTTSHHQ